MAGFPATACTSPPSYRPRVDAGVVRPRHGPARGSANRRANAYFYVHRDVPGVRAEEIYKSRLVRYTVPLAELKAAAERSLDCAPVLKPPLDFDACWLACLARARSRGDTRRGGFLDTCLEPCYPPPGDECRSAGYRIVLEVVGLAADSAAIQARWAALSWTARRRYGRVVAFTYLHPLRPGAFAARWLDGVAPALARLV